MESALTPIPVPVPIPIRKILLVGFPKSGTSSFQALFQKLGFPSYHYMYRNRFIGKWIQENRTLGKPLLSFLHQEANEHDTKPICITQMDLCLSKQLNIWPQIECLDQLTQENPDTLFILNKRDIDKLYSSFQRWNQYDRRLYFFNRAWFDPTLPMDDAIKTFFREHYRRVEAFFAERPHLHFVSFDIEVDSPIKLAPWINVEGVYQLPHENKNTKA